MKLELTAVVQTVCLPLYSSVPVLWIQEKDYSDSKTLVDFAH